MRDWELHLKGPMDDHDDDKPKSLTHSESFNKVCADGDLDIVKAVVEKTQVDLEVEYEYDENQPPLPLHNAAENGRLPVVQYLCEQGADKEARDDMADTTALAAENGHLPVVQYLCEQGADKEARDDSGKTPLLWAALQGPPPCGAVPM